jgi:hypothetical protein
MEALLLCLGLWNPLGFAEKLYMAKKQVIRHPVSVVRPLAGVWLVVYWCGRALQVLGLLLIWWVLLLFAGVEGMGALLFWSVIAAAVFYAGWACTVWARRDF